jgi:hypothetical protein
MPKVNVWANQKKGEPGDQITFSWTFKDVGQTIIEKIVKFDGNQISSESPYNWIATPGVHILYLQVKLEGGETYITKHIKIEISEGKGHFNHSKNYHF